MTKTLWNLSAQGPFNGVSKPAEASIALLRSNLNKYLARLCPGSVFNFYMFLLYAERPPSKGSCDMMPLSTYFDGCMLAIPRKQL